MAECKGCGKRLGFLEGNRGFCQDCFSEQLGVELRVQDLSKDDRDHAEAAEHAAIERVVLTTETASNLAIVERIEIVTAECAFGMNIFKDLFADVRNIVGGRSEAVQKTMRDARRTALYELKREAYRVGANAVVGVDLDYVELSAHSTMIMLVASGTAVRLADAQ